MEDDVTKTLSEFGKRLPIGYRDPNGEIQRNFALREWDWDLEESIGDQLETAEISGMGHVTHVVACGLKTLGSIDFDKLETIQRLAAISNMYYSDVLMVYVWIRIEGMGPQLRLESFKCEKCKKLIDFAGDLRGLEVHEIDPKSVTRTVALEHGVRYADQIRNKVNIEPIRWSFFESDDFVSAMTNQAKFKRLALQNGVVEVEGVPGPAHLTRSHLKSMKPREIVKIVREIDAAGGGVVMEIEDVCPHCKAPFSHTIDWRYGDFFGRSVQ